MVGSFNINMASLSNPSVIYKDYRSQVMNFEGLRPDSCGLEFSKSPTDNQPVGEEINYDSLSAFKIYPNIATSLTA